MLKGYCSASFAEWRAPATPSEMEQLGRAQLSFLRSQGHDGGGQFMIVTLSRSGIAISHRPAGVTQPARMFGAL